MSTGGFAFYSGFVAGQLSYWSYSEPPFSTRSCSGICLEHACGDALGNSEVDVQTDACTRRFDLDVVA